MTDLEATRLCAEAMGWKVSEFKMTSPKRTPSAIGAYDNPKENTPVWYDPLHDDAQCMALEDWLIERGRLLYFNGTMTFSLNSDVSKVQEWQIVDSRENRRRAIVFCVAAIREGSHD